MADEIVSLLKYVPRTDIRICPRCEAENPYEGKNCYLCGTDLNMIIRTEPPKPVEPVKKTAYPERERDFRRYDDRPPIYDEEPPTEGVGIKVLWVVTIVLLLVIIGLVFANIININNASAAQPGTAEEVLEERIELTDYEMGIKEGVKCYNYDL